MTSAAAPIGALYDAVCRAPRSLAALGALAAALVRRRELDEALHYYRAGAQVATTDGRWHRLSAQALTIAGESGAAADAYRRALALTPTDASSWAGFADLLLCDLDDAAGARAAAHRALTLDPDLAECYVTFAASWGADCPLSVLRAEIAALQTDTARADLRAQGLAMACRQAGRYEESRECLLEALRLSPGDALTAARLALVEHALAMPTHGTWHAEALARTASPTFRAALFEAAMYAWRLGNRDAASRLFRQLVRGVRTEPQRESAFAGRSIVLVDDIGSGYGDRILWSRIASRMHEAGSRVVIECPAPLRALLSTASGVDGAVLPHDEVAGERWLVSELLASCNWLWPRLVADAPYLDVPAAVTRRLRARALAVGDGLQVGVEGATGRDRRERDPYTRRAVTGSALEPLLRLPGVTCHSLHAHSTSSSADALVVPTGPQLLSTARDFLHTAAAIAALDVVVTVDTAVAHVAGALGTPTVLLLPYVPDWRWGDAAAPFPWYASVRRCQQSRPGDWQPVIADAVTHVTALRDRCELAASV